MGHRLTDLVARKAPSGVLFDWDGTMADSTDANWRAMAATVAPFGVVLDRQWFTSRSGTSSGEMLRLLLGGGPSDEAIERLSCERDDRFLALTDRVEPFEDALEVLAWCRAHEVPTAVASGGSRRVIEHLLATWQVSVDTVVGRVDVRHGKPDPEVFLLAADRLQVPPATCLVLEDAEEGLEAARRAGMGSLDVRAVRAGTGAAPGQEEPT